MSVRKPLAGGFSALISGGKVMRKLLFGGKLAARGEPCRPHPALDVNKGVLRVGLCVSYVIHKGDLLHSQRIQAERLI